MPIASASAGAAMSSNPTNSPLKQYLEHLVAIHYLKVVHGDKRFQSRKEIYNAASKAIERRKRALLYRSTVCITSSPLKQIRKWSGDPEPPPGQIPFLDGAEGDFSIAVEVAEWVLADDDKD